MDSLKCASYGGLQAAGQLRYVRAKDFFREKEHKAPQWKYMSNFVPRENIHCTTDLTFLTSSAINRKYELHPYWALLVSKTMSNIPKAGSILHLSRSQEILLTRPGGSRYLRMPQPTVQVPRGFKLRAHELCSQTGLDFPLHIRTACDLYHHSHLGIMEDQNENINWPETKYLWSNRPPSDVREGNEKQWAGLMSASGKERICYFFLGCKSITCCFQKKLPERH